MSMWASKKKVDQKPNSIPSQKNKKVDFGSSNNVDNIDALLEASKAADLEEEREKEREQERERDRGRSRCGC